MVIFKRSQSGAAPTDEGIVKKAYELHEELKEAAQGYSNSICR
ncbi:hypothetical protein [Paenibacillus rigui]|nr:hypothetical protein [Paenibacillus rigui]